MLSNLRCPNTRCLRYKRRLEMEVGQDDRGIQGLTVEHWCLECLHREYGPPTPTAARHTSRLVQEIAAENLRLRRLRGFTRDTGVEVPMTYSRGGSDG